MNVLLLFTYETSLVDWKKSGILSRELKPYKMLHEKYKITFTFVTYGDDSDIDLVDEYDFVEVLPIHKYLKKKQNKFYNFIYTLIYINSLLKKNSISFDLIKTNQLKGSWLAIVIKFVTGKPLIARTGFDLYIFSRENNKGFLKLKFYYLLTLFTLNISDLYSVSSESDYEFINKKYLFKKDKLKLRRNWISIKEYEGIKNRPENKFLTVGRLEKQKDYEYLINLFNSSQYTLDIIGAGSLKNELVSKSENNINFLGKLDFDELLNKYKEYKYFIMASNFEGNPKSLVEAMSAGCIVFAPDIKNIIEIITDGENGYIYSKELNNLFEILQSTSEIEFNKTSENAFQFAQKEYSIDTYIEREWADYLKVTNSN